MTGTLSYIFAPVRKDAPPFVTEHTFCASGDIRVS